MSRARCPAPGPPGAPRSSAGLGAVLCWVVLGAAGGCSRGPGDRDPESGATCADVAEDLLEAHVPDLALRFLRRNAPGPEECDDLLRMRLYEVAGKLGDDVLAYRYLTPRVEFLSDVIVAGVRKDIVRGYPGMIEERFESLSLEEKVLFAECQARLGDFDRAARTCLRSLELHPKEAALFRAKAIEYAREFHGEEVVALALAHPDLPGEKLAEFRAAFGEDTDLPSSRAILSTDGRFDAGVILKESTSFRSSPGGISLDEESLIVPDWLLIALPSLRGSFELRAGITVGCLPWSSLFYIGVHGGGPFRPVPGSAVGKGDGIIAGIRFYAMGSTVPLEACLDAGSAGGGPAPRYLTGSWTAMSFVKSPQILPEPRTIIDRKGDPAFRFRTPYRIRISYWEQLREICITVQAAEEKSIVAWRGTLRDALPPAAFLVLRFDCLEKPHAPARVDAAVSDVRLRY